MKIIPTLAHDRAALQLVNDAGDEATVLVHGAHVVSWRPVVADGAARRVERLYLSPQSRFAAGSAIRGGVPVIFPQFNRTGPDTRLPRHGFARTANWRVVGPTGLGSATAPAPGSPSWQEDELALLLEEGQMADGSPWPHPFRLELGIRLGHGSLDLRMTVFNDGSTDLPFSAALHSYFAIDDIDRVRLEGLDGVEVSDRVEGRDQTPTQEAAGPFRFDGEVDRIYLWPASIAEPSVRLGGSGPALAISQEGFDDMVVWNPGPIRARALDDMPDDGYRRFVCVEAAKATRPVTLGPGLCWTGVQRLAVD